MESSRSDVPPQADASSRSSAPATAEDAVVKPLPSIPSSPPPAFDEPYRDEPTPAPTGYVAQNHWQQRGLQPLSPTGSQVYFQPYTDNPDGSRSDDDVPLAHLYPYPTEAPPAYHIVVQQSYRDTLISHIPNFSRTSVEIDEEAGVDPERHDDVRFRVEAIVASFLVAMILFLVMGMMIWWLVTFGV